MLAFVRYAADGAPLLFVANFTPVVRRNYRSGAARRVLARGPQHRRARVRRLGRRQPRRRRRGARCRCAQFYWSLTLHAAAARRVVPPARRRRSDDGEPEGERVRSAPGRATAGSSSGCGRRARSRRGRRSPRRSRRAHRARARGSRLPRGVRRRARHRRPLPLRDRRRAAPRSRVAFAARRRARRLGGRRPGLRVVRSRVGRPASSPTTSSTSSTSARSPTRARSTRRSRASTTCATLGITAIELMPVAAVPRRAQLGLRRRVPVRRAGDATAAPTACAGSSTRATRAGSSVVLDVVYNHLGPEGNVLGAVRPVLHRSLPHAVGRRAQLRRRGHRRGAQLLRRERALTGSTTSRSTRCGSTPCTRSSTRARTRSSRSSSTRCTSARAREGRHIWVIAESAANDARLVTPKDRGGIGCDAQWSDDFHHALHALLTGERDGYYADFGAVGDLATAYREALRLRRPVLAVPRPPLRPIRGRACRGSGSSSSPRTTTRSATARSATGCATIVDHEPAAARRRGHAAARRSSRCSSWARSTARRARSRTSSTTAIPSSIDAVRRGRRAEFARVLEHAGAAGPGRAGDVRRREVAVVPPRRRNRTRRSSHGTRACSNSDATAPRCSSSTRVPTRTQVFEDERVLVVTREAGGDAIALVLGFGAEDVRARRRAARGTVGRAGRLARRRARARAVRHREREPTHDRGARRVACCCSARSRSL